MANTKSGTVAFFEDDHKLLEGAKQVYKAGYREFDSLSPFPVHGMDDAMGLKRSFLPWVTFFGGLTGLLIAVGFQSWINLVDWPMNIGGKPAFGLPAFVPIIFELTVLIGGLSTVAAMLWACGLPKMNPPIIDYDLTSHKFALFIPSDDRGYNREKTEAFLRSIGASEVRQVEEF